MALTHLTCQYFRGGDASADRSSYVALNPHREPGSLVFAGACAAQESISSQVACRLALEHFVDGVLKFYDQPIEVGQQLPEMSLEVLETAFRNANNSVYDFGHKLAAGGRMAASLLGLVIEQRSIASGRVGPGSAYLLRQGELFPFFDSGEPDCAQLVGSQSLLPVELASVEIEQDDLILAFHSVLDEYQETILRATVDELEVNSEVPNAELFELVFPESSKVPFSMVARVGPDAIYLNTRLEAVGEV